MGILLFVLILGVLVIGHELGHFLAARIFKIKVEEFGIGFPPKIASTKKNGITYSINALPLGGFVKLLGEDGQDKSNPDSFGHKPIWQRAIVLASGVFMNFMISMIILVFLFSLGMPSLVTANNKNYVRAYELKITNVDKSTPAAIAGIKTGDKVLSLNYSDDILHQDFSYSNLTVEQFQKLVKNYAGKNIVLVMERQRQVITINISPRINPPINEGPLGVSLMDAAIVAFPWYRSLYEAPRALINGSGEIISAIFQNLKALIVKTETPDITGPIGIAVISSKTYQLGWRYLASFISVLSLNLAVLNLLPLPALDGGRIFFLILEKIRRKPVPQKIEATVNNIGFTFLLLLILLITIKDIKALI